MTTLTTLDWTETLTGEMLLFGLLGRDFQNYPAAEERPWLQTLIDEDMFQEAPFAASQPDVIEGLRLLQEWSRAGLSDSAFEDLQSDYTYTFIGPDKVRVALWESVYFSRERLTFQEQTLDVRGWYRRFGLQAERIYHEPDDHIGLELAFLALLAQRGISALERGEQDEFNQLLRAQREFFDQHPNQWATTFCEGVLEHARTPFYKGLALLTRGALIELAEILPNGR